jgi:hypothetical protein
MMEGWSTGILSKKRKIKTGFPLRFNWHPASSIRHPASGIQYPASGIRHPVSGIQYPASRSPDKSAFEAKLCYRVPLNIKGC